ncbi:hypothetical protein SSOG_09143 [Streptomyces himastatinicus ATCC 53653]|uniref:Uncharacterized protein n=1 Tax=Streptomyces himastatinicus ATCC 53653 TaxID=457427 RepID=D9WX01_9ACTN|nr:hypothetical protein [Streptomyces himastatinicus]EFL29429.1 hypothetical protein SSOG_09143 [Streptomyces himastatinicus ATCC 53653]
MPTPSQPQIKQRMLQRRADRLAALAAPPFEYHATTTRDDDGISLCGDCLTEDCTRYWRIRRRIVERRLQRLKASGPPF